MLQVKFLLLFLMILLLTPAVQADIISINSGGSDEVIITDISEGEIGFFSGIPTVPIEEEEELPDEGRGGLISPELAAKKEAEKQQELIKKQAELCKSPLVYVSTEEGYVCMTQEQIRIRQLSSALAGVFIILIMMLGYHRYKVGKLKRKKEKEKKIPKPPKEE